MRRTLGGLDANRLERSCEDARSDSIRFGPSASGIDRAEVFLSSRGYEPHRHDTYGIGITIRGVLIFHYRGSRCLCLPGQLHILHPDETHDGGPRTDDGLGYRIMYIAPELIRDASGGRALPFVADPVQGLTPGGQAMASVLADIDEPISELNRADIATTVADGLLSLSGPTELRRSAIDIKAVRIVRDYLAAYATEQTDASVLEKIAGIDRFTMSRHFRWAFGTSPDRYRTHRRLDLARIAIDSGLSLARAAAEAGFADQSHMTRQFKRTYGLTPGRWMALRTASSQETSRPSRRGSAGSGLRAQSRSVSR